MHHNNIFKVV